MKLPKIRSIYFIAVIATVGGMLFGFDISSISAIIEVSRFECVHYEADTFIDAPICRLLRQPEWPAARRHRFGFGRWLGGWCCLRRLHLRQDWSSRCHLLRLSILDYGYRRSDLGENRWHVDCG
jgi:hypothetical protein